MDLYSKSIKYKYKINIFKGGDAEYKNISTASEWISHTDYVYINSTTKQRIYNPPHVDVWIKMKDEVDVWYKNPKTKEVKWELPHNAWLKKEEYTDITNNIITNNPPNDNIWRKDNDDVDVWYVNLIDNTTVWELPPYAWLRSIIYTNPKTNETSDTIPLSEVWKQNQDNTDTWYVSSITNESVWVVPPNSWILTIDTWYENSNTGKTVLSMSDNQYDLVTKFIYEDLEIHYDQGAGDSDDIWPIITNYYKSYGQKLRFFGKNNRTNVFKIIPNNVGNKIEPILGKGTYTAVYVIYDQNKKINDNYSNNYILRLYARESNYNTNNMFDYQKVKDEYNLFEQYMAVIFLYGSIFEPGVSFPISIDNSNPLDYNITKIYNTLSYKSIAKLTNKQKIKFLLENIKMLDYLASNNYIHCDYKIDNIAYDDPETMNVVLIDYDITTLQPLVQSNPKFTFDDNNNVNALYVSSTYPPTYIRGSSPIEFPVNVEYKLPLQQWDKYSIGGLVDIIESLNITYNFSKITLSPGLTNGKIRDLISSNVVDSLKLNSINYKSIPTYKQLYDIFRYLNNNNYIA